MNLSQYIKKATDFAPIVGIVGGILGLWSFIDNYLLIFKPKIFISPRIIFNFTVKNLNQFLLDNIGLSIKISNHRKKYGAIHDFALRIYMSDEVNPEPISYFSSDIAEKINFNNNIYVFSEITEFSPIAVQPNSSISVTVMFGGTVNELKQFILPGANYYLELYYQRKQHSKWVFVDRLFLYNITSIPRKDKPIWDKSQAVFTTIDYKDSRKQLNDETGKKIPTIYSGALHRQKINWINSVKYFFVNKWEYVKQFFFYLIYQILLAITWFTDRILRLPIIRKYNTKRSKIKIRFGNPEMKPALEQGILNLKTELTSLLETLNKSADSDRQIYITQEKSHEFVINRYHMSLLIYKMSDDMIRVQEVNARFGKSKIKFTLEIKQSVFKTNYWYLKKHGVISMQSFAIKIMDFLVLHDGT